MVGIVCHMIIEGPHLTRMQYQIAPLCNVMLMKIKKLQTDQPHEGGYMAVDAVQSVEMVVVEARK